MEPENTTPPEPNKPFGPAAEASQPTSPAMPQPTTPEVSPPPPTSPTPTDGGLNGPATGPLPPAPGVQPSAPVDQPLPPQSGLPTDPAVQPVSEGLNQQPAMPTPVSTKAPRNTSLPAILLAGVVILFLVVLAVYAFTKMK